MKLFLNLVYSVSHSVLSDSAIAWAITCQAPLSMEILEARIQEWVTIPFSKGSSGPKNQVQVCCIQAGYLPYELPGKPKLFLNSVFNCSPMLKSLHLNQHPFCVQCSSVTHSVMSISMRLHGLQLDRLFYPCDSPGKNTGVGYINAKCMK